MRVDVTSWDKSTGTEDAVRTLKVQAVDRDEAASLAEFSARIVAGDVPLDGLREFFGEIGRLQRFEANAAIHMRRQAKKLGVEDVKQTAALLKRLGWRQNILRGGAS